MPRLRMTKARIEMLVQKRHRFCIELNPRAKTAKGKFARLWELRALTSKIKTRPGFWRTSVVFQAETLREVAAKAKELLGADTFLCYFHRFALPVPDGRYMRFHCMEDLAEYRNAHPDVEFGHWKSDTAISLPMYLDDKNVFDKHDAEECAAGGEKIGPRPGPSPYDED